MTQLLSHIVRKRFSAVNEDVATDALQFILSASETARNAMMKLLRGFVPELPDLRFYSQQAGEGLRPDMWGYEYSGNEVRAFIENKFWAGLTDQQPVGYLKRLADSREQTLQLFIVPEARRLTLWHELLRRVDAAGMRVSERTESPGLYCETSIGPVLALISWRHVLSVLAYDLAEEPGTLNDLRQLQALCEAADEHAFIPFSGELLTDQTIPTAILQLGELVFTAIDVAAAEGAVYVDGLRSQADWERIGRYVRTGSGRSAGYWIGIHFRLWKHHGRSPIWMVFADSDWGKATEVRRVLEPWSIRSGRLTANDSGAFCIALDVSTGEEKDRAIEGLAECFGKISRLLLNAGS